MINDDFMIVLHRYIRQAQTLQFTTDLQPKPTGQDEDTEQNDRIDVDEMTAQKTEGN